MFHMVRSTKKLSREGGSSEGGEAADIVNVRLEDLSDVVLLSPGVSQEPAVVIWKPICPLPNCRYREDGGSESAVSGRVLHDGWNGRTTNFHFLFDAYDESDVALTRRIALEEGRHSVSQTCTADVAEAVLDGDTTRTVNNVFEELGHVAAEEQLESALKALLHEENNAVDKDISAEDNCSLASSSDGMSAEKFGTPSTASESRRDTLDSDLSDSSEELVFDANLLQQLVEDLPDYYVVENSRKASDDFSSVISKL